MRDNQNITLQAKCLIFGLVNSHKTQSTSNKRTLTLLRDIAKDKTHPIELKKISRMMYSQWALTHNTWTQKHEAALGQFLDTHPRSDLLSIFDDIIKLKQDKPSTLEKYFNENAAFRDSVIAQANALKCCVSDTWALNEHDIYFIENAKNIIQEFLEYRALAQNLPSAEDLDKIINAL